MKCPKCNAENPVSRKFCRECGERLQLMCPHCNSENIPGDKFCGECGYKFDISDGLPPVDYTRPDSYTPKHLADKILNNRSAIEGERKIVTVLFADVANYTAMAEKLDPEIVHQIMDGAFKIIMDEIHGLGGTINQFTGDGVMALFGAPAALEDHAQRACKAALAIQSNLVGYSEAIDRQFQMRIGLNSGYVVVGSIGDDLRMDYTAVGDTTNLAARIQQAAGPGEVWISEDTHHIVHGYFDESSLGQITLKGKSEPQVVYRIVGERAGIRTRFQAGLQRGVTELVGRKPEMAALGAAFEKAAKGEAQLVDISGEAGVGKSRLVHEFSQTLDEGVFFLTGACVDYGHNINFLPLIDIVRAAFTITRDASEAEAKQMISSTATDDLAEMVPFYQNLLSLKVDDPNFDMIQPEGRKFGTFEAVKKLLFAFSRKMSLVIFVEDVHWIDEISREFFTYFTRHFHGHPVLVVANYRPEFISPWTGVKNYQKIILETLSSGSSARIVRNMLGGKHLDPALEEKIVAKTGGNPFFVEEMIRELQDRGDIFRDGDRYEVRGSIDELTIPSTVQGVLAARMDRLTEDLKETMQVASVIGRDFAFRILKRIMALERELGEHLAKLVGFEILYEKALYPELEYIFTHALTQEVAYESLLIQRRKLFHEKIAITIENLYEQKLEEYYEVLSYHYEKSGNSDKTLHYSVLAGEKSILNGANQLAYEFFHKALTITQEESLEVDPEIKFKIHFNLGMASYNAGGFEEGISEMREAHHICRQQDMIENEKQCLYFQGLFLIPFPDIYDIEKYYKDLLDRAKELKVTSIEGAVLGLLGCRYGCYGDLSKAYEFVLEAEKLTANSDDIFSQISVRSNRAFLERWIGRPRKTLELEEGIVEMMLQSGEFAQYFYDVQFRGNAQAEIGNIEEGIATLQHAINIAEEFQMFFRIAALYNSLGYCYGEIYQSKKALPINQKGVEISQMLMEKYPAGKLQWAEMLAQSQINIIENVYDQNNFDDVLSMIERLAEEMSSKDFSYVRHQWETRLYYNLAKISIEQNKIEKAHKIIQDNLDFTKKRKMRKREGSFVHLLGKVQMHRNELENATNTIKRSIEVLEKVGNPRLLWETYSTLAIAYNKLGHSNKSAKAWGHAKKWVNMVADGMSDLELKNGFLKSPQIKAILSESAL